MKKTALLLTVVAVLIFGAGASAWGSLVSRDLAPGSGDGLITFDPLTGLEWLDLPATQNLSYAAISTALADILLILAFAMLMQTICGCFTSMRELIFWESPTIIQQKLHLIMPGIKQG
ncbi:MAG: hypothetical protein MUO63_03785 [Desulfobulbaceae bacterium]|nr:hypothetical protein [Desulfobulbaceae bacterium]